MNYKKNYKSFVGPEKLYEKIGKIVFDAMIDLGLKKTDKVLDIGCGSLRVGQHLINYLNKGNYFGIDPNKWLIDQALAHEKIKKNKNPIFDYNSNFDIPFEERFDFVLANSVFIHASLDQIKKCFENVYQKLDGKFLYNYIPGIDNKNTEWTYPSAVTYEDKTISKIINDTNVIIGGYDYRLLPINIKYPGKQTFFVMERLNFTED